MRDLGKMTWFLLLAPALFGCVDDSATTIPESGEGEIVTVNSSWFDVSHISPRTYAIEETQSSQGNVCYLVLGTEEVYMFDTGAGENQPVNGSKVRHILEQITSLPITLVQSHFHFDHNQNIAEFDRVAFPALPFLQQDVSADSVYTFTSDDLFYGDYPAQVKVDTWLPLNTDIDLGNRIIELVNIPGHADESVAIIDRANKLAFLGDFLYNGALFLFGYDDLGLYEQTVDYLISTLDSEYRLYGAHGNPLIQYSALNTLKGFLQCVGSNSCEGAPTTVLGESALYYEYQGMSMVVFQ